MQRTMTATAPRPVACAPLTWPCRACGQSFRTVVLPGVPLPEFCSYQHAEEWIGVPA